MPTVQSTYRDVARAAFEGMIANTGPNDLISRTVQTAAIGFGKAVKQGTTDNTVQAATAQSDVFRGITVRDESIDPALADQYAVGASATILIEGVIWVKAGATVAAGAAVYMIVADGRFTSTAGSNLLIPRAIFDSSGVADGLVRIRLA